MKRTLTTERAWAAGLFDGEGCTCVHRQRLGSYTRIDSVRISIRQNDREVLDRFQRAVRETTLDENEEYYTMMRELKLVT